MWNIKFEELFGRAAGCTPDFLFLDTGLDVPAKLFRSDQAHGFFGPWSTYYAARNRAVTNEIVQRAS
jgi:hypothetical protein